MRRLAAAALSFSAAIFLANYILPLRALLPCAAGCALLGVPAAMAQGRRRRRFMLIALGMAAGFACFAVHAYRTTIPARLLSGETRELSARLLDYPKEYDGYCRATVRITDPELPQLDAILYDNSMSLRQAAPGQSLRFAAKLSAADTRYGEKYDYYNSRNIYLTLSARSEIWITERGPGLKQIPVIIQRALVQLIGETFPEDAVPFMRSLMLGDKSELYQDEGLHLALSRAGILHALAVSGLHIAFLVGLVQLLMGINRRSAVLCVALVWLFVLVTGAPPSAVRAGLMQSLLLLAPLLRRENDPITSLSAALALILLFNPYAAASVSLQLSFAAMAGILCFAQPLNRLLRVRVKNKALGKLTRYLSATAASSLAVLPFSVPLMAVHFGYLSILSPLSNLLCLWAVSLCFQGGYLACLLTMVFQPLGTLLGALLAWPVRYIELVCRVLSSLPFAAVFLRSTAVAIWVVVCYALFIAFGLSRIGRWEKLLAPTLLAALSLALTLNLTRLYYDRDAYITVLNVGQGQCITAFSGQDVLMIDCGGLGTLDKAGETAGAYLISRGRKQVDVLVLTHLDTDHVNGVPLLMEMLQVKTLIVPPQEDLKEDNLRQLLEAAQRAGTRILYLEEDALLQLGGIRAALFAPLGGESANDSGIMALLSLGSYDMLVTGDASASTEEMLLKRHPVSDLELLIVGHHGSKNALSERLLASAGADTAVISVGYNNYGHPAQETLERLAAYGYNVHRTDEDGDFTIRIRMNNGEEAREK